jgi:hypothetical protein
MKLILPLVVLGTALLVASSHAQVVKLNSQNPDYGKSVFYASVYDQHTVVRFKAKIKGFSTTPAHRKGDATDYALAVLPFQMGTDNHGKKQLIFAASIVNVELGPEWFVKDQDVKLKVNDMVEITGSRMIMNGEPVIMAQMVRKGVGVLAVRQMSGEPYWYDSSQSTSMADIEQDMRNSEVQPQQPPYNWGPQPEGQQVWQSGSIQIYGGAYQIGGGNYYNVAGFIPLVPLKGGVTVLPPGYWYSAPPTVVRY